MVENWSVNRILAILLILELGHKYARFGLLWGYRTNIKVDWFGFRFTTEKNQWSFGWHHGDERYDSIRSALVSLVIGPSTSENKQGWISSWWFQPLWKILVKMGNLPQVGVKTKNIWNHQPDMHTIVYRHICSWFVYHHLQRCCECSTTSAELQLCNFTLWDCDCLKVSIASIYTP